MKEIFSTALAELELFLNNEHLSAREIVDYLRDTPLPFTACFEEELSIDERFHYSFRFLQVLGKYNLPLAVGFCMNQYMAYSIACLPTVAGSPIHILKKDFLQLVKQQRWILAVSSFDDFIRNQSEQAHGVTCVTQVDGSIVCNGVKNFQSNISVADVLLFSAVLDGQKTGLFFTFLKDTPGIILGEPVYTVYGRRRHALGYFL